ncbi:MAG: sigma-70 family RNA polymerase sigma factor [Chitinophagaceae bacterium]|nr:sigma-70 family RNA polymerase sigma factor [Chitinophagaceae bacterium]
MGDILPNEKAIVQRISNGDETAFETFVTHYGPQLEQAVFRAVKSNLPVRDIMQDVFLSIWIAREKLENLESPRTWLFRMAYYRSYTWLRKQAVRDRAHTYLEGTLVETNTVEEHSTFEETRKFVQEAIEQLPPRTKMIYSLSRDQHLPIDEIARRLNLSPQTIKNTLTNALKSIRNHLEENGILLPAAVLCIALQ